MSPRPLASLLSLFERVRRGETVHAVVSTPPRHGKTESILHGLAWLLGSDPGMQLAYASYSGRFAESKSRKARQIAQSAGVPIAADSRSRADWRTGVADGGLWATSIGGSVTGQGFNCLVVDDPTKGRAEAESSTLREHVYEWFTDDAFTRLEPRAIGGKPGSCLVVSTRWHTDDLAGRLIQKGWECVNLPAINDDGEALWPERWPVEALLKIKDTIGEYGWSSLYQGAPRPRGGSVFNDVRFYDKLPATYRVGIGVDLAYTAKTHSDWCAAVAVAESGGNYYVLDVKHEQATPPAFAAKLRSLKAAHPGARMLWYTSTTEVGLADLLRSESGIPIMGEVAKADKFVRAQPIAAAWNAGKVFLPGPVKDSATGLMVGESPAWTSKFVTELMAFTGVNDKHDDQVDALAAAFDVLERGSGLMRPKTVKSAFEPYGGNPFAPTGKYKW